MELPPVRLLAIENDPLAAGLLKGWLQRERAFPFEMEWRSTMEEALERVQLGGLDLLILDLNLPDSPPKDTLTKVRTLSDRVPVVVLSSEEDLELGKRAIELGAQEVLVKGQVNSTILSRTIIFSIERHRVKISVQSKPFTDELTGLFNKAYFGSAAEQMLEHARRKASQHCLMLCEVFDLSETSGSLKPVSSQSLLVSVALVLRKCFRASDLIARVGDNSFAILALDSDFGGSRVVEHRLETMLFELHLAGYFGFAVFDPKLPRSLEKLMETAKTLLDREKNRESDRRRHIERLSGASRVPPDLQTGGPSGSQRLPSGEFRK